METVPTEPDPTGPGPTFPDHLPTVPELLRTGRERFGPRDAVVTPDGRLSYVDLDRLSRSLAGRLVAAGVGKGSRVGILLPNGIPWVLTWAAASRVGAVVVPVNTFYRPPELQRFLRHSDVQFLVGVPGFVHHDYVANLELTVPGLAERTGPDLYLADLPQLRRVLFWEASPRPWGIGELGRDLGTDGTSGGEGAAVPDAVIEELGRDVTPGDVLIVTYTSGSTGEPKGVVHSHGALVRHATNLAAMSGITAEARLWTPMPLCWVGGFAFTMLRAFAVGAAFVTQEVFEPGAALRLMEQERVSFVSAWPAVSKTLREHPDFASTDLSAIRGGSFPDALPPDRRPADPGLHVGSLGMSETCGPHTFWRPGEDVTGAPEQYRGNFGHEVPGTEHRIVDTETGADLPEGVEGEVLVRGYSLMLGLYKKERSEVLDSDGWYHTGDRGYFRDGWFFFTGRQSDLIKASGSNVAPIEVEMALQRHPDVKLAFVFGVRHPDRGEDVVALVVPTPEAAGTIDADGIRLGLRDQLSSYKVPRRIITITDADVPWMTSQKADRRALGELAEKLVAAGP
jgi:acyl-CoA synthetase (AMP-forming)/AMP-acid ligase II